MPSWLSFFFFPIFSAIFLSSVCRLVCLPACLQLYMSPVCWPHSFTPQNLFDFSSLTILKGDGLAVPRRHWELWYSKKTCLHSLLKFRISFPLILCKRWSQYICGLFVDDNFVHRSNLEIYFLFLLLIIIQLKKFITSSGFKLTNSFFYKKRWRGGLHRHF